MNTEPDRRRDRLATIPNALGAASVALMMFVLTAITVQGNKITRLETQQDAILAWQSSYDQSPWNSGGDVMRWLSAEDRRLQSHERRLDKVEEQVRLLMEERHRSHNLGRSDN